MTIEALTNFRIGVFPRRSMWQTGLPDSLQNIHFPAEFSTALLFADEVVLFPHGPRMDGSNECVVTSEMHSAMRSLGVPFSWGFCLDQPILEELDAHTETDTFRSWNFVQTDEEIAALVSA